MKIKLTISLIFILFAFGCTNSNEPNEPQTRTIYYLKDHSGSMALFNFNTDENMPELMSMKNIKNSTMVAENGRLVLLEENDYKNVSFYGVCEGNLIEVPMPDDISNEYETAYYNIDVKDYPMQIDNEGHNFIFMTFFKQPESDLMLFPILARFNCEKWEMNIINFKNDFLNRLDKEIESIFPNPNIIINKSGEIFFSVLIKHNNISKNLICKIVNEKLQNIYFINSPSPIRLLGCMSNMDRFIYVETDYGEIIKKFEITADQLIEINQNSQLDIGNHNNNIYQNYYYSFEDDDLIKMDLNSGVKQILLSGEEINELLPNAEPKECIVSADGKSVAFILMQNGKHHLYYLNENSKAIFVDRSESIDLLSYSGVILN
jgi:hypothetical protein